MSSIKNTSPDSSSQAQSGIQSTDSFPCTILGKGVSGLAALRLAQALGHSAQILEDGPARPGARKGDKQEKGTSKKRGQARKGESQEVGLEGLPAFGGFRSVETSEFPTSNKECPTEEGEKEEKSGVRSQETVGNAEYPISNKECPTEEVEEKQETGFGAGKVATDPAIAGLQNKNHSVFSVPSVVKPSPLVIVSPGLPPSSPLYQEAIASGAEIVSELEFGFRAAAAAGITRMLAITGTNGKTTTTELTVYILKALGINAVEAGNIGVPLCDVVADALSVPGKDVLPVIEVSSFQLERCRDFAPLAAVILNIESDHLDRYPGGFEEYSAVKFKIFDHVPAENRIVGKSMWESASGGTGLLCEEMWDAANAADQDTIQKHTAFPRFECLNDVIMFEDRELFKYSETRLRGEHNLENLLAALELVSRAVPETALFSPELKAAACSFHTGEHRLEKVAEVNGVCYINDSKATNPASVIAALKAVRNTGLTTKNTKEHENGCSGLALRGNSQDMVSETDATTPAQPESGRSATSLCSPHSVFSVPSVVNSSPEIYLILGGLDKAMDFSPLREYSADIAKAYIIGECRQKLFSVLHDAFPCELFNTFEDAVQAAFKDAANGGTVLLAPGCASMDMFRNYKERGEKFKQLVKQWVTPS